MKPHACRTFLNDWRTQIIVAGTAIVLTGSASAQESRSRAGLVQLGSPTRLTRAGSSEESSPPDQLPPAMPIVAGPRQINAPPPSVKQVTTAPASNALPQAMPIPTSLDRKPAAAEPEASTLPPLPPADDQRVSLRQRRAELREMGLKDPTMKVFVAQVGAPPPNKVAPVGLLNSTNDPPPSFLRGMLARFTPSAATPSESTVVSSGISQTSAAAPATSPPMTSESPGLLSRLFGNRPVPTLTTVEQMPRTVESMGITPISTNPPLRTP